MKDIVTAMIPNSIFQLLKSIVNVTGVELIHKVVLLLKNVDVGKKLLFKVVDTY